METQLSLLERGLQIILTIALLFRSEVPVVGDGDNEGCCHQNGSKKEWESYPAGTHTRLRRREAVIKKNARQQKGILEKRPRRREVDQRPKTLTVVIAANQGSITKEEGEEYQQSGSSKTHRAGKPAKESVECQHQFGADAETSQNETEVQWEKSEREDIKFKLVDADKLAHRRKNKDGGDENTECPTNYGSGVIHQNHGS